MPLIPFAEWAPDQGTLNSKFTSNAKNVLPAAQSYIPFKSLGLISAALPAKPLGGFTARTLAGQVSIFAGTATKLYKLNNTTLVWDHVSKLAADQVTNGTFAADTDWTKDTSVTISGGTASWSSVADGDGITQAQSFTAGRIYKVVFTVSGFSSGGVQAVIEGGTSVEGTARTANGTYTEYLTAVTGNNAFAILASAGSTTLDVDNVTVQELAEYSATDSARWDFAQFGENVVAVNVNDPPQVFDLGSDSEFSDLSGSPPQAAYVDVWGDFLVLMQLSSNANRVHWSALNDITGWTPGTDNSDTQDFPDGGSVQGATSTTNPIIFMERAIYYGTFVPGSTEIFTFQKVHDLRGAASPYSVATRGIHAFYADEGGFFQVAPDGSLGSIGREKVDRDTFENLAASDIAAIQGVADPFHSRAYFGVDDDGDGYLDRILTYDWDLQRWSQAEVDISIMFPAATTGYTLEGLDAISGSIDALAISLDSRVWQGGAPVLAAFNRDHKLGFYSGTAMEATLETQEFGDPAGSVQRITEVVPVVDAGNMSDLNVSYGARYRRSDVFVYSAETTPSTNTGIARKNSRARFHKIKLRIVAGATWTHASGVHVNSTGAGLR